MKAGKRIVLCPWVSDSKRFNRALLTGASRCKMQTPIHSNSLFTALGILNFKFLVHIFGVQLNPILIAFATKNIEEFPSDSNRILYSIVLYSLSDE